MGLIMVVDTVKSMFGELDQHVNSREAKRRWVALQLRDRW